MMVSNRRFKIREKTNPSSLACSNTPVKVTLDSGEYEVKEIPEVSMDDAIENLENGFGLKIDGPIATFSEDCIQNCEFNAQGSIAERQSQFCNI